MNSYAMNVLSIMKMLSNASNDSSEDVVKDAKSFGFSVKDILDLPTNKSKSANNESTSSSASNTANRVVGQEFKGENSLSLTGNTSIFRPALYFGSNICDTPYTRCLPPFDMTSYSSQIRKSYIFSLKLILIFDFKT